VAVAAVIENRRAAMLDTWWAAAGRKGKEHVDVKTLERLLDQSHGRLDINAVDEPRSEEAFTALCRCASHGHLDAVRLLLARGADPNACAASGFACTRPLVAAAHGGHVAVLRALAEAGAKLDDCRGGYAALHVAAEYGRAESVQVRVTDSVRSLPLGKSRACTQPFCMMAAFP
jgi:purine nucleoside permease